MPGHTRAIASVTEYIASQPPGVRSTLRRVRAAIRKALPKAEETLSYRIPAYKLGGKAVIYFAAWKSHYSMYPATRTLVAALGEQFTGLEIAKGTIRFSYDTPVPIELIGRMAKFRATEARQKRRN
jgi:uncharacterized protein YdhG (YjbR/CyaY superfamily)